MSRVELFASIRRDKRLDPEVSQRALAERYGVHRRTVRQALDSAVPPTRKAGWQRVSVLDPAKDWIDAILREDLTAPRKQRHTIERIFQRLAGEYGFSEASYSTLRDWVNKRRPQIAAEAQEGRGPGRGEAGHPTDAQGRQGGEGDGCISPEGCP